MNLVIFLVTLAAHVPFLVLESNHADLNPPETIVSYDLDQYSPVLVLGSDVENVTFEVEQLTPVGKQVFKTTSSEKNFVVLYGTPCDVRARVKIGGLVSDWSRPAEVIQKFSPVHCPQTAFQRIK